jgi:hypothetical protein
VGQLRHLALIALAAGAALCLVGTLFDGGGFLHSYLYAYVFWTGVTAGSLGLLMLHHVAGGGWGFVLRRPLEAASRLLPLMLLLSIPILLNIPKLYEWAAPGAGGDHELRLKAAYLNVSFFVGRTVFYFALWIGIAYFLNKWSAAQDESDDPRLFHKLNLLSAGGIVAYVLSVTFAIVDWVMSLAPHWNSSIIGLLFVASQALSALSVMLVLVAFLAGGDSLMDRVPKMSVRDLGNLLLAMVMLWAYLSFSQYLITYSGNTAEEAAWYAQRRGGGWGAVGLLLIPLHFALPFLILLVPAVKRDIRRIAKVAAFLVLVRLLDLFWWVTPTFHSRLSISINDFGAPLLIGGLWVLLWLRELQKRPLLPVHDPRLQATWHLTEAPSHG